ncbi:unnamed protein product [Toxocara canis]|uniref:DRIM domain-containing protein n=1 Tax=Toxocara canis TaxID=6265 RepID=A0A183UD96_TOXCA|nr:unnamed protein product [Toxocara canis]
MSYTIECHIVPFSSYSQIVPLDASADVATVGDTIVECALLGGASVVSLFVVGMFAGSAIVEGVYVSFTEQIANLSGDVTRWQMALPTTTTERETFFYDAIVKCNDNDYGGYYKSFLEDIPFESGELRTYAQLLHHQKTIFDAIIKHLAVEQSTSLVTVLELTIAFARDLREDLSIYLWELFEAIITLLEKANQQAELLETGFRALAVLFKLQWRKIVRELRRTFLRFERLFSSKRGYLRRFAAEAFAFLLRKSNSIGKLTAFLAETAEKEGSSSLTDGISQLYFNTVKGVMRQFHSSASQIMTEMIDASLSIEKHTVREMAVRILEGMMSRCASYAKKEYTLPIVDVVLKKFVSSSQSLERQSDAVALSKLLLVWVTTKKGASLPNASDLMNALKEAVAVDGWIPQKDLLKLVSTAILTSHMNAVLAFFDDLCEASMFDVWLMPAVGKFSSKMLYNQNDESMVEIFKFYARLCAKRKPLSVGKVERISFFDISQHVRVRSAVVDCIQSNPKPNVKDMVLVGCAVCAYPWLWRQAEKPQHVDALVRILRSSMDAASAISSQLSLLTAHTIALIDTKFFSSFTLDELIQFVRRENCSERALRILHIILPNIAGFKGNDQWSAFEKVIKEIVACLGHWDSAVRQIALEVLNSFDLPINGVPIEDDNDEPEVTRSVFEILLEAERTPLTLDDYRRRLMLLRKVSYGAHVKHMPKCENGLLEILTQWFYLVLPVAAANCLSALANRKQSREMTIPLRVIIAQLFERFTIYWPPLFEIIESYANGLTINVFWPIVVSFIKNATAHLVSSIREGEAEKEWNDCLLDELTGVTSRRCPDYAMFRLQMFNLLSRFEEIAERRTKTLSPMLIALYREEYQSVDFLSRNRQDITWKTTADVVESVHDEMEEPEMVTEIAEQLDKDDIGSTLSEGDSRMEDVVEDSTRKKRKYAQDGGEYVERTNRKMIKRTLIALLETFAKFKSPRAVYMANEIRQLYDELLLIPDEEVQKAVLKCLFAYKYKFLTPYKENFENVVSDKTFLNELIRFGVDAQDSAVTSEHRADVIPILMRLLYGKMQTHVTNDVTARRAAIFRFLAGCRPGELDVFIGVLFAPLFQLAGTEGDEEKSIGEMCSLICRSFDPTSMVPLARIKGSLNSLSHVVSKLSASLADYQRTTLYRLCLTAAVLIRLAVQCEASVYPKNMKILKELRGLLFFAFQRRTFTAAEINALFEYFITPLCDAISSNEIAIAPQGVLRLFESWTEVPLLFFLLQVRMRFSQVEGEQTPLSVMCNCLSAKSTNTSSKDAIIKAILNLLTLADEENSAIPGELNLVEVQRLPGVNLGTALVLSQLPKLLSYIIDCLPPANEKKKINLEHLDILSSFDYSEKSKFLTFRLGEFVNDSATGERLASTLLTYVERGALRSEEALNSLLLTVSRLIPAIEKPLAFLPFIVQQFSTIKVRSSRDALCQIVDSLAKCQQTEGRVIELLAYISDLNAYDPRSIDEPDYERRHSAYNQLSHIWDRGEAIDVAVLQMIAHNHYFTISETNDISLRGASSTSLRRLIEYAGVCAITDEDRAITLEKHLLPLVLKGLHIETEAIRHEFISALVSLIIAFPAHKELHHLAQLRNVDEIDLDFFENISHIQVHRRQRALRRLTDSLEAAEIKIPAEVMLRFLLPLIQPYITDFTSKTSALSDEAVRLLSHILGVAPWKRYYPMLDFYLKRLQRSNINQKANVRSAVL